MSSVPRQYAPFLNKLGRLKNKSNGGYLAHCPAHEDRNPSLSVDFQDGTMLLLCFSGCSYESIMAAVGLTPADGFAETEKRQEKSVTREIVYQIAPGIEHVRLEYSDDSKTFHWRRDGKVGLKGTKTEDLPLYGLERIGKETAEGARECLILCEGEKAADSLWGRGWIGLGTVTGAAGCPSPKMLLAVGGGFPILWPDEDEPGLKHMERVARNIAFGNCPFIIRVPGAKKGEDAADYAGDIGELVGNAIPWELGMLWKESESTQPESKLGGFF